MIVGDDAPMVQPNTESKGFSWAFPSEMERILTRNPNPSHICKTGVSILKHLRPCIYLTKGFQLTVNSPSHGKVDGESKMGSFKEGGLTR